MITALLYIALACNAAVSLFAPWIGMVGAYLVAVMAPHEIWWWVFGDLRPYYWVILPTLAGFGILLVRGKVDFSPLNTKLNVCVFILWLSFTSAYYFGPYVHVFNQFRFYDAEFMFSTLQKTYLAYFVATLLFDDSRKLRVASIVLVVTTVYMTYWANMQYFSYHKYGRMHGPVNLYGQGIYLDENDFATLFVIGAPFVFYFGAALRRRWLGMATWLIVPLTWHAMFLTASRGALLATGATIGVFALRTRSRAVGMIVLVMFLVAFSYEAGDLMKSRSATISNYEDEDSAASRIEAWKAATGMMIAHPLTGVGFASFGQAFPDFSSIKPRVAHNTFFQIGGEWGVTAGITYLVLVFSTLNRLRKNGKALRDRLDNIEARRLYYLNESCLLGLTGFFVCACFLSLQQYEMWYFLMILSNGALVMSARLDKATTVPVAPRPRLRQVPA